MNLAEIKQTFNILALPIEHTTDKDGNISDRWVQSWPKYGMCVVLDRAILDDINRNDLIWTQGEDLVRKSDGGKITKLVVKVQDPESAPKEIIATL